MTPTSKKMKRLERKKKKLEALIEITALNNKDRIELESQHIGGPSGDHSKLEEPYCEQTDKKKKKMEKESHRKQDEDPPEQGECDQLSVNNLGSLGSGDIDTRYRKSKKKRKTKHEECKEGSAEVGHNSKSETKTLPDVKDDEWPTLSTTSERFEGLSQKRKSTFEIQKERPQKMVKRYSESYLKPQENVKSEKPLSFVEELESFRRDVDRSKRKHEKKHKEKKSVDISPDHNNTDNVAGELPINAQDKEDPIGDDAELDQLRRLLRERKKQLKEIPMVRLKGVGADASLELLEQRIPILPGDVQNFLLLSQLGHDCPRFPRWMELRKFNRVCKTAVLIIEGASAYSFFSSESSCPTLRSMDIKVEMVSPYCYNSTITDELCAVPISRQQQKVLEKRFGKEICPEALITDRIIKVLRSAFSISSVPKTKTEEVEKKITVPLTDKFPRTELLLSAWQLIEEGYPLPYGSTELGNRYPDYVMSKDQYAEVTPSSPMWALDCEMCLTRVGNELTRVSVVNEKHEAIYESLCLPRNPIKDYLTEYSGITPAMLKGVTTRLEDIQRDLRELLPADVILVGQSLNGDLHALKMMHPYIIDTSVIFNLSGVRKHKSKLSHLAREFLNEAIQQRGADGHDSVEDSLAALKLVQHKLTKSIEYGDAVLVGPKNKKWNDSTSDSNNSCTEHNAKDFDDLKIEVGPTMATSLFKHVTMRHKTVTVIGQEETLAEYSTFVAAAHKENKQLVRSVTTNSNAETIDTTCHECKNSNFTLAHLVLNEEEDGMPTVDTWVKKIYDSPPFNSLIVVILVGSHDSFANGACLIKVKKPSLKLKSLKKV